MHARARHGERDQRARLDQATPRQGPDHDDANSTIHLVDLVVQHVLAPLDRPKAIVDPGQRLPTRTGINGEGSLCQREDTDRNILRQLRAHDTLRVG